MKHIITPQDNFFSILSENNNILSFGKESRDIAVSYVTNFNEVIDIGAHVGISVLDWSDKFKMVYAFEPMLDHYKCLETNTENLNNVKLFNCAISDEEKTMHGAYRTSKNSGSFQILDSVYQQPKKKTPRQIYEIESKRLDNFEFLNVGLIKIDVEGWELEVLKGAVNTINKFKPVLLIEFTGGSSKKSLHRYDVEEYYKLIEFLGYIPVSQSGDDTIYVHKELK
jgi:hypothetical protein